MEDLKKREDTTPVRRRLTFTGLFRTRKETTKSTTSTTTIDDTATSGHRERSASSEAPTPVTTFTHVARRERSNTLDSFSPRSSLHAAVTVKERRVTKRATVSFEMCSLAEELGQLAAAEEASSAEASRCQGQRWAPARGRPQAGRRQGKDPQAQHLVDQPKEVWVRRVAGRHGERKCQVTNYPCDFSWLVS